MISRAPHTLACRTNVAAPAAPLPARTSLARLSGAVTKHNNRTWLLVAVAAAVVAALVLPFGWSKANEPLNTQDLRIRAADLRSLASECALLAQQATTGTLDVNYFDVHSSMLKDKTRQMAKSLDQATAQPGLEPQLSEVTAMAQEVDATWGVLLHSFADEKAACRRQASDQKH